jgi:hypothetical protein
VTVNSNPLPTFTTPDVPETAMAFAIVRLLESIVRVPAPSVTVPVPNALLVIVPAANPPVFVPPVTTGFPAYTSVPAVMLVPPVYVLGPERVSDPVPVFRSPAVPANTLVIDADPADTLTVGVVPPRVMVFGPATVISPLPVLLNVIELRVNGPMSFVAV